MEPYNDGSRVFFAYADLARVLKLVTNRLVVAESTPRGLAFNHDRTVAWIRLPDGVDLPLRELVREAVAN